VIYSGCQWGTLVLLAKLGNPTMVGQYSLALAIATPIFRAIHAAASRGSDD